METPSRITSVQNKDSKKIVLESIAAGIRLTDNCMPFIVANDIVFWCHFGNYLAELLREQNALWFLAPDSDFRDDFSFFLLGC